jgi:hypothetical protein
VVFRPFATARGWTIAPGAVIIGHRNKTKFMGGENMLQKLKSRTSAWLAGTVLAVAACAMFVVSAKAQNKEPIKIGFSMALTGPLAANGKRGENEGNDYDRSDALRLLRFSGRWRWRWHSRPTCSCGLGDGERPVARLHRSSILLTPTICSGRGLNCLQHALPLP